MASASTLSAHAAQAAPLPIPQEPGTVPEWVMLARTGAWLGHPTAREVVEPRHLSSALDYFERHYAAHGTDLVIDYGHASMAAPQGRAPAAGWVNRMELRGDELWGRVLWTTEAAGAIARREYRCLSPVFRFDRPDRLTGQPVPLQIHSVALTNTPFLTELESLNTAAADGGANHSPTEGGMEMPILQSLAAALDTEPAALAGRLGLAADADERAVAEALVANAETVAPDAPDAEERTALVQLRAEAAALRAKLGLTEDAPEEDVLNALDAADRCSEAEELVDGAVREGRVPPAHRDFYLREALGDLRAAREVINSLPVLTAPQPVPPVRTEGTLTDGEETVRRQLGLSAEQMLAARAD